MTAHTLILLRHGESDWNQKNLFTGWVDVDLTEKGRTEAVRGGHLMADAGLLPDVVHTSVLRRAINTANLTLDAVDRHWIPVRRSWRLNERHYGALQGLDKAATRDRYGDEQFMLWRRSFDVPPPPIEDSSWPRKVVNDHPFMDEFPYLAAPGAVTEPPIVGSLKARVMMAIMAFVAVAVLLWLYRWRLYARATVG